MKKKLFLYAFFFIAIFVPAFSFPELAYAACASGDLSCGHWVPGPDATYTRSQCVGGEIWDDEANEYYCPSGTYQDYVYPSTWEIYPPPPPAVPTGTCHSCVMQAMDGVGNECEFFGPPGDLPFVTEEYCNAPPVCTEISNPNKVGFINCNGWTPNAQCFNNIDDDGDGYVDYGSDANCSSKTDNSEAGPSASVTVSPSSVAYPGSVTVGLSSTNGYYCYARVDGGDLTSPGYFSSGSWPVSGLAAGSHQAQVYCYDDSWQGSGWQTQNFTVTLANPTADSVTISSPTVIANGTTQYTITIVGTDLLGGSNIYHENVLINYQGGNAGAHRGYVVWFGDSIAGYSGWTQRAVCSGGGAAGEYTGDNTYGDSYLNVLACSTSVSGNTRTSTFTVTFDPSFTTPAINNDISGNIDSPGRTSGWVNFDINFSVTAGTCNLPWGGTIAHGSSVTAYQAASVVSPVTCTSESRSCNNGALSGSYVNASCSVTAPVVNGSCSSAHYSCSAGTSASNASNAADWTWTCTGSGGGTNASCSQNKASCTTPWGATVASGSSVTAYQSASVVSPATCTSESRACSDGVLSGTHTNQSCTQTAAPTASFTSTPSCTIASSAASCSSTLAFTVSNASASSQVKLTDCGGGLYATYSTSGAKTYGPPGVTIPYSGGCYQIRDANTDTGGIKTLAANPTIVLAEVTGPSVCAAGSAWNGTICQAAPTVSLTPDTVTISLGQSTFLTWTSTNATSCSAASWEGSTATSAGGTVSPLTTTSYSVTCTNSITGLSGSDTSVVTVTIPTASFTSTPYTCTIASGASSCTKTVSWTSTATSVDLTDCAGGAYTTLGTGARTYGPPGVTIPNGSGCYQVRNSATNTGGAKTLAANPTIVLAEVTATSVCAAGTGWNGSVCAPVPTVSTLVPLAIVATSTNLRGSANPNGFATTGWFRFSTVSPGSCNDTFGTRSPASGGTSLGSGSAAIGYNFVTGGMSANTTYYYCAIASNSGGTGFGSIQSFTTTALPTASFTSTPSCTIASGAANCASSLTFTASNVSVSSRVKLTDCAGGLYTSYSTSGAQTYNNPPGITIPYNSGCYQIRDANTDTGGAKTLAANPTIVLAEVTGSSVCAAATSWNGSSCVFGAPTVANGAATSITGTGATLNGTVNPNGSATTGWYRYSTVNPGACNDTFGTRTPTSGGNACGSGSVVVAMPGQAITGLTPGTTYYACAVASNSGGVSPASNAPTSFTTTSVPTCSTFSVPATVNINTPTTVTWSCQNATSCTELSASDGFSTGGFTGNPVPVTVSVTPTVAGPHAPYGMTCYGPGALDGVTVQSNLFDVIDPKATITANPSRVSPSGNTTITATCSGIPNGTAQVTGPTPLGVTTNPAAYNADAGQVTAVTPVSSSGTYNYTFTASTITAQSIFTITCTPAGGAAPPAKSAVTVRFKIDIDEF